MLPVLQAIVRVFDSEGDRQNRNRARLKFVLRRAGIEQFRVWVDEMLTKLPTRIPIAYQEPHPSCATGLWSNGRYVPVDPLWVRNHVKDQRQSGFVSVLVWLPCGDVTPQQLHAVATAAQKWGDGEVRTTPTQNLLLRWVRRENLPALYDLLCANGLTQPCGGTITDVTSCPGSKTCQVGVTHSRALAESLMEELQGEEADEDLKGATIKISGCPHACSQHHVATIGFYGASKKLGGQAAPYYQLMIGGKVDKAGVTFARPVIRVPARRVPQVVQRILGLFRGGREPGETLPQFLQRIEIEWLHEKLHDLAVEEVQHGEDQFFVDWGASQPFAIGTGQSDCTA
jgi:sulfite reductase beta subunit-like hemoprotein